MTEREKLLVKAFDTVMGSAGMPSETDPDYELWLFNAFITALEAAGVRLVPESITPQMGWELENTLSEPIPASQIHAANWQAGYAAMLAASPYAPEEG